MAPRHTYADWPQWRGPNRDDISSEKGLLKVWPEGGPPRVWMFENAGVGYSGPAIVGGKLYTMGARDKVELLLALDANTAEELWNAPIGDMLENNWGDGPRGTPTVEGDFIYAIGAQGNLVCVRISTHDVVWKKSMQDLGGKTPTWGFTESPLVYKDMVLCTPGFDAPKPAENKDSEDGKEGKDEAASPAEDKKGGSIAALNKATGEVVWQSDLKGGAFYSSIVTAQVGDAVEGVQFLAEGGTSKLVGFDVTTGKGLWSEPWPGKVAVIPTPIVHDQFVYCTSGYGAGSMLLEIGANNNVQKLYDNKEMVNHHGGVILLDGHVYGYSDGKGWTCQDFQTGEKVWTEKKAFPKGAIGYADGMFYCLGEDKGEVVLIEASTEGWKEHGRFKLDPQTELRKAAGKIWTHPVICDGKLYLRDQNLIYCYDVREKGTTASASSSAAGGGN